MALEAAVLGIDAAWTERRPSGVALVRQCAGGWKCVAVAPSYDSFMSLEPGRTTSWEQGPVAGSRLMVADLLRQSSRLLGGGEVTVVAVDMPLSRSKVNGRRHADDEIARLFGRSWCGTHSPTANRPGRLSDSMREEFAAQGYSLAVEGTTPGTPRRLLEVYPHVGLLGLVGTTKRVPYKVAKSRRYWPMGPSVAERRKLLIKSHLSILSSLQSRVADISVPIPDTDSEGTLASLKRLEDALDALVCCWVGIRYLEGGAVGIGDHAACIWVPQESFGQARQPPPEGGGCREKCLASLPGSLGTAKPGGAETLSGDGGRPCCQCHLEGECLSPAV